MAGESDMNVSGLTVKIVAAHVGNDRVAVEVLPKLIQSVHRSLTTV